MQLDGEMVLNLFVALACNRSMGARQAEIVTKLATKINSDEILQFGLICAQA
jgi:hypothetical protein